VLLGVTPAVQRKSDSSTYLVFFTPILREVFSILFVCSCEDWNGCVLAFILNFEQSLVLFETILAFDFRILARIRIGVNPIA